MVDCEPRTRWLMGKPGVTPGLPGERGSPCSEQCVWHEERALTDAVIEKQRLVPWLLRETPGEGPRALLRPGKSTEHHAMSPWGWGPAA